MSTPTNFPSTTTPVVRLSPSVLAGIRAETYRGGVEAEPSPEAVFWQRECAKARTVASELMATIGQHPGVVIVADYDSVTVAVDPAESDMGTDLWDHVRETLGVTTTEVRGWFLVGDGEFQGERIRLVGHGMVEQFPAVSA